MPKHYPLVNSIIVHITDGDTNGSVTYNFPYGRIPTEDEMPEALEKIKSVLPDGFRLMTRHESLIHFMREERGYRGPNNVALPRLPVGDEWHDPDTANVYMPSDEEDWPDEE